MSITRLWAFLAVALPTLAALIGGLPSVDLAYNLRAGAEILDTRAIPNVDTWTYTAAGVPWVDQQWGAQVILTSVYRLAGWSGVDVLRAALVAAIFACLFEIGRRRGLGIRSAAWLTLAAFLVVAPALGLRPQLMGMALFALVLLLVSDRRTHPRYLLAVPAIVLFWANIHGSFFLGPVVLGLAWLEDLHDRVERPHRTLILALVSALAACVTPFGPGVWVYALGLSTNSEVSRLISEWQPPSVRTLPGLLFFGSALALVAIIARRGRVVPWPRLAALLVFFAIGLYAIRGLAWWPPAVVWIVAGVIVVAPASAPAREQLAGSPLMRRLNAAIAVAIVVAGVLLLPFWRPIDPQLDAPRDVVGWAPPGITATIRALAQPGDRLFNPQEWGSWFEFALPDLLVAMDSRIEMYPAQVWVDYDKVLSGRDGWQDQLTSWRVTIAAIMTRDQALADRLSAIGWRTVYSDKDGSVAVAPGR